MRFLWSDLLWLLLIVPVLVAGYVYALRRRKKLALRYASLLLVREAVGPGQWLRRHLPAVLVLLALICALLGVARPTALLTLPYSHQTIVLAMDVSRSMRAADMQPSRLGAAQNAVRAFIKELRPRVRVGIVTFAGSAAIVRSVCAKYAIPRDRVFVAGLSAGGAMAAIMGETYPELYGAIGVHSGLAYGSANDVMSAFTAMRGQVGFEQARSRNGGAPEAGPRTIVFHGSADTTVHPSNAERIIAGHSGSLGRTSRTEHGSSEETRGYSRLVAERDDGTHAMECWMIEGAQHAWSGGNPGGSYTDFRGPNASAAMVRFFLNGVSDVAVA